MPEKGSFPKIVLLVDDEPQVLLVMKAQLEYEGYAVITETSGKGALEVVKNTKLMCVLLDLGLPDMGGFDVLKEIKAIKATLPVVIVTGNHEENEARKSFEFGAWDYVTKPIDFKYLTNILLIQSQQ